jgi:hypothetical protein
MMDINEKNRENSPIIKIILKLVSHYYNIINF